MMRRRTFNQLLAVLPAVIDPAPPASAAELSSRGPSPRPSPWSRYLLGTAYYPEWWTPSEWEIDFRQMHDLGINTVRMGEFAWARFEPAPSQFEFAWMDHAIALARHYQIDVILATPSASVPPWLYQLHPDVLGANAKGPYTYGGRKGYCTNSANYLEASARITTALAEHYGHFPGIIGWQLDNEPGYPFECFDPNCENAFRLWLQERYGTLQSLNHHWNGAFWSNEYSDWSQIHFPVNSAEGGWQPAISLEYRRFFSDSFLNHLRRQAVILRQHAPHQFLFTNWPSATWSVNVFSAAQFLDSAAWDNYVSAPGLSEFQHQYISGFHGDFCRCAGPEQRYLCAEQIAYLPANAALEGLRLEAYINLAHGARGHLYFEWRRPLAGNEQFRPSLIKRFDGTINPAQPAFEQIGKEFARLGPLLASATTRADIALLYDFDNEWAQGFGFTGNRNEHYDTVANLYYRGFKVLQRNIDILPVTAGLSPYRVVLASNLRLVDDALVASLRAFVSAGGVLVLNNRAGTQNLDASMKRVLPPGPFADLAGVSAEAKLDLIEYTPTNGSFEQSLVGELGINFTGSDAVFHPHTILESLALHGAEPIASFRGGQLAGRPAVTRHPFGQGWVFYVATDSTENAFHETLARHVATTAKLDPLIVAPYGIEVTSREDAQTIFYFLLNLTETSHPNIALPKPMDNLIDGRRGLTSVSLARFAVAVLASPK
jgi:beta-galactosidase